jgi:hypothetical protein
MASYSRIINYIAGLVLMVFCQTAVSCDLPQGFGKEKASLTLVLPGVPGEDSAAVRNSGTRAIHLPEEISSLMRYSLEFYPPGGGNRFIYPESGTTSERVVTVELEPGLWDIAAIAWYGSDMTALDKAPQVDIQAGRENSISFTMKADDFVTPDLSGSWVNQNKNLTLLAPPESLSITLAGTTAFSGISGWNDSFFYQGYYEDADGTRHNLDQPPVSFSGPGTSSLSYAINPAALGIGRFTYYAEVSNNYTYTPVSGAPTSGTATKSIYVAAIGVVSPVGTSGPGGGIIFYYSAAGFTSNGATCHYLEAAPYE